MSITERALAIIDAASAVEGASRSAYMVKRCLERMGELVDDDDCAVIAEALEEYP